MQLRSRALWLVTTTLALTAGVLPAAPMAQAVVPKAPTALTPSATSVSGAPTLEWTRATGATSYTVQLSKSSEFTTIAASATTVNRRWVPTAQLPQGEVFWRVRATNASGTGPWAETSFIRGTVGGPALASPANGDEFTQPNEPAILTWDPSPGARAYQVQISSASSDFPADSRTTTTRTTNSAFLITSPQINQPYFWHVRAELATDVYSEWSEVRSYSVSNLADPVLTSPADSGGTSIQDMVLDWQPVPGARAYDVRLSTDINFSTIDHQALTVTGTRYSPPTTLGNDQYYWQVRPIDTFGQATPWESVETWTFRRHWPEQPGLTYPTDGAVVGDPFFFQWTPAEKASRYVVQISTNQTFDTIVGSCTTVHNTVIPTPNTCMPGAAGTYYWRVFAYDDPKAVPSEPLQAEVRSFSYLPEIVDMSSATPADGATVSVPTLKWDEVPGAAKYQVYITRVSDGAQIVAGTQTYATTFTPRAALTVGTTYRWWVRTVTGGGRSGVGLTPSAQNTFTVSAQAPASASSPTPTSPASGVHVQRFPNLTWTPVTNATHYRIWLRDTNTIAAPVALPDTFTYPAGDDTGTGYILPGTYEWYVEAFNGNSSLGDGSPRTFVMDPLAAVTGQRVAMSGTASASSSTSCTDELPQRCTNVRQSPVLRWNPVANAGSYKVVLSKDNQFTNVYATYFADTNAYIPTTALPESQAEDAYYWIVLPCKYSTQSACRALAPASHAFSKLSNAIDLLTPANDPDPNNTHPIANEITFTWRDYLATNFDPANLDDKRDEAGQNGGVEAKTYRIQVGTTPNFSGTSWSDDVDQTTYTEYSNTYPEGVLYWHVRAIDHTGNLLPWSETRTVYKKSPAPVPTSPLGGAVVAPGSPLRWAAQNFADGYEIEVYRDGDTSFQPVNRVAVATTQQSAWAPPTPLPVRTLPYVWRIRRIDFSGFKGPWSSDPVGAPDASFRVRSVAPAQTAPAAGAYVLGNGSVFSWLAVDDAERYRFERRKVGETALAESVSTVALAWAPTALLADGAYEWRVVAVNNQGADIRASAWRPFKVDSTRPVVSAKGPTGTVSRTTNFNVRFSERVTNVTSTSFRVYRAGYPTPLSAKVTLSSTGRYATINPASSLLVGKYYYVKLTAGIKDPGGNRLVPFQWKVKAK